MNVVRVPRSGWLQMGRQQILATGLLALLLAAANGHATQLYRYINEKGYQEIGHSIPPHLVPNGYDVIDESGRLVRRVAPQLSEDEYAAKLERDRIQEECEKALTRVKRLYQSMADIDQAELLYERNAQQSMQNDQVNMELAVTELKRLQQTAARFEREGTPVPENELTQIARRESEIRTLSAQLQARRDEIPVKAGEFEEDRRLYTRGQCESQQPVAGAGN